MDNGEDAPRNQYEQDALRHKAGVLVVDDSKDERTLARALAEFQEKPSDIDLACADVLEQALAAVLMDFGIKPGWTKEQIAEAMEEADIGIAEADWDPSSDGSGALNGLYIFRKDAPIAFVSMPFINHEGKVSTKVVRFYKSDRVDEKEGGKLIQ